MNKYTYDYLNFGRRLIRLRPLSKIPMDHDWVNTLGLTLKQCQDHNGNFGMCLDDDMVIVDVDIKNDKQGLESYKKLCDYLGTVYEPTVITASGGYHVYFSIPKGMTLKKKVSDYPDIDFLSKGTQVLIAGSTLLDKTSYSYGSKGFDIKEAPNLLIELLDKNSMLNGEEEPLEDRIIDIESLVDIPEEILKKVHFKTLSVPEVYEYLYTIPPDVDYADWIMIGMALYHWDTTRGLVVWDNWSKNGEKYKKNECSAKWKTFKDKGYVNGVHLGSVIRLANSLKKNTNWYEEWAYDMPTEQFVQLSTGAYYKKNTFDKLNSKYMPFNKAGSRIHAHKWAIEHDDLLLNLSGQLYYPDSDKMLIKVNNKTYFNSFNKNSLPEPADTFTNKGREAISKVVSHINMICNFNEEHTANLLQYLAHNVQYMGEKINWCPVLYSGEGTGKTFFADLMKTVLGESNVGIIGTSSLESPFNNWAGTHVFVFIEELKISGLGTHITLNNLKPCISNSEIEYRVKYRDIKVIKNKTNYFITTNHYNCIPIHSDSGRRFYMLDIISKKQGKAYFDELFQTLIDYKGELRKFFLEYPITKEFKGIIKGEAPTTEYKRSLTLSTSTYNHNDKILEQIIKDRKTFIDDDLTSLLPFTIQSKRKTESLARMGYRLHGSLIHNQSVWIHTELVGKVNDDDIKMYLEKEGSLQNKLYTEAFKIEKELEELNNNENNTEEFENDIDV